MAGINKVILVGNLGKDPEVRALESGAKVAQFSLATTESYKDREGNWQDKTEWHNIVMWRYLAERAEKHLHKGMQIYVEGKLRTRQWTDQNNQTRYTTEVLADKFIMLGRRSEGGGNYPPLPDEEPEAASSRVAESSPAADSPSTAVPPAADTGTPEDDLPF